VTPLHAFSFWAFLFVAFVAVVWALGDVLAPFIIGIALAYLLDPVADRLEAGGLSRRGATGFILGVFLLVLLVLLALVGPIVFEEVAHFLHNLPRLAAKAQSALTPYAQWLHDRIGTSKGENLTQTLTDQVGGAVSASGGGLIAGLQARGLAILRFLSMAAVMPIVAYYMILEWDHLVRWTRDLLPRRHEATVLDLLRRIDERLAGFLRGQIIVCVTLGLLYAVALSIAGLDYGLVIGLGAGLLSIIPLVGSTVGLLVGVIVAWTQTGELSFVAVVAGIFAAGQFMEGNILTPRLVGQSAGLHPLWILLALMAGGSLLGITGMLLAVPVAIVVAVLGEFALSLYRKSPLYACASEIVKPAHACLPPDTP
jgi:predicted PurR-regulated permease PerM